MLLRAAKILFCFPHSSLIFRSRSIHANKVVIVSEERVVKRCNCRTCIFCINDWRDIIDSRAESFSSSDGTGFLRIICEPAESFFDQIKFFKISSFWQFRERITDYRFFSGKRSCKLSSIKDDPLGAVPLAKKGLLAFCQYL